MGSLLAVVSEAPASVREDRLRAMAERSPYRGALRTIHLPEVSIGIQARADESSLYELPDLVVACNGRVYDASKRQPEDPSKSSAERLARAWSQSGAQCLCVLDGEFSLIVHDKRAHRTTACVSLSMTRPAFWARHQDQLVIASEVRQVAAGAGIEQRLDIEQLVQSLCVGGPILDPERTEYIGINRLVAPNLYQCSSKTHQLQTVGCYWSPPPTESISAKETQQLPETLLQILSTAIDTLPRNTGFSLSGGYDSGTLWAVANRPGARPIGFRGYGLTFPGSAVDEGAIMHQLLLQTRTSATLIDASRNRASEYMQAHTLFVDRIPGIATLYYVDLLGKRMQADGITCQVAGIGAEAWLCARDTYAADLLRDGQWVSLIADALRFQNYSVSPQTRMQATLRFIKIAAAPPGSRLRRLRGRTSPPVWLHHRWHALCSDANSELQHLHHAKGFSRSQLLQTLKYHSIGVGFERIEQLNERYGIELAAPFMHRAITELGFSIPARAINGGRHPKHLIRLCAQEAIGAPPPWSPNKLVHNAIYASDARLILDLGSATDWRLVELEIITGLQANKTIRQATTDQKVTTLSASLAYKEAYVRHYGTQDR